MAFMKIMAQIREEKGQISSYATYSQFFTFFLVTCFPCVLVHQHHEYNQAKFYSKTTTFLICEIGWI